MATPVRPNSSFFFFFFITIFSGVFHGESSQFDLEELSWLDDNDDEVNIVQSRHDALRKCEFNYGKWVYDQSYPLYDSSCPYLSTAVTCQKNGRPDSDYEKWRWKPHRCSIPRYLMYFYGTYYSYRILIVSGLRLEVHKGSL